MAVDKGRAFALTVATLLVISGMAAVVMAEMGREDVVQDELAVPQYVLASPDLVERFRGPSDRVNVTSPTGTLTDTTDDGLRVIFEEPSGTFRFVLGERADTMTLLMNTSAVMRDRGCIIEVEVFFKIDQNKYYKLDLFINPTYATIGFEPFWEEGGEEQQTAVLHDVSPWTALMMKVGNGEAIVGIDGLDRTATLPTVPSFSPILDGINVWVIGVVEGRQMVIDNIAFGTGGQTFKDGLHKTMVPYGKDFAFTYIIHADRAYPGQLGLMANISEEYGLCGTYDAWTNGTDRYYGMDDPEFLAALHELQGSGWDIGLHAGSNEPMTREQIISSIEDLSRELGAPRSWSDHAFLPQDLAVQGGNASSSYYTADLVSEIGLGWAHAWHGTAFRNDLNRIGMGYQAEGLDGLPLYRVSKDTSWDIYGDHASALDLDQWLGAWPMERSLIVVHDYFAYLSYASNATGRYSVLEGLEGMNYLPWGQLYPKQVLQGAEWRALPQFEDFLNWTISQNVWFTTLRDAYDRSQLVDRVLVHEYPDKLVLTNTGNAPVLGLTLYSRSMPDYALSQDGTAIHASKGTASSWHFIIDLGPGEVLVLRKVHDRQGADRPSFASALIAPIAAKVEDQASGP
jgi:hypothetical protein